MNRKWSHFFRNHSLIKTLPKRSFSEGNFLISGWKCSKRQWKMCERERWRWMRAVRAVCKTNARKTTRTIETNLYKWLIQMRYYEFEWHVRAIYRFPFRFGIGSAFPCNGFDVVLVCFPNVFFYAMFLFIIQTHNIINDRCLVIAKRWAREQWFLSSEAELASDMTESNTHSVSEQKGDWISNANPKNRR